MTVQAKLVVERVCEGSREIRTVFTVNNVAFDIAHATLDQGTFGLEHCCFVGSQFKQALIKLGVVPESLHVHIDESLR